MEKWDAYTREGIRTGQVLIRDMPIPDGLYHLFCEVLVRHVDGSYLCMKRSMQKPLYPGYYEATAGGSALMGEDAHQCIERELREETGLCGYAFEQVAHHIIEEKHGICYCFLCTVDCAKDAIRLQEGETDSYRWLTEEEFIAFINSDQAIDTQRARYLEYFKKINYMNA